MLRADGLYARGGGERLASEVLVARDALAAAGRLAHVVVECEDDARESASVAAAKEVGCTVVSRGEELVEELAVLPEATEPKTVPVAADGPYVVSVNSTGVDILAVERRSEIGEKEVEMQTEMWALNFRDVLVARGAISSNVSGQNLGLGGETVGTVTRVGAGVTAVRAAPRTGCGGGRLKAPFKTSHRINDPK